MGAWESGPWVGAGGLCANVQQLELNNRGAGGTRRKRKTKGMRYETARRVRWMDIFISYQCPALPCPKQRTHARTPAAQPLGPETTTPSSQRKPANGPVAASTRSTHGEEDVEIRTSPPCQSPPAVVLWSWAAVSKRRAGAEAVTYVFMHCPGYREMYSMYLYAALRSGGEWVCAVTPVSALRHLDSPRRIRSCVPGRRPREPERSTKRARHEFPHGAADSGCRAERDPDSSASPTCAGPPREVWTRPTCRAERPCNPAPSAISSDDAARKRVLPETGCCVVRAGV